MSSNRHIIRLVPALEACGIALLAALLLARGIVPGWRHLNSDFPNYYLVARLFHNGYSLDRIYDAVWLQRIKDHWGLDQPLVGFFGLTPLSALPILPLAGLSALAAKHVWIAINIAFLFGTVEALARTTTLGRRRIWLIALMAILPLRSSFLLGQMHIAVLLLLALAWFFHRRCRPALCGICLALAGALKIYPLLFFFYFLWKRSWREAFALLGCTLVLFGAGAAWMGSHLFHIYLLEQLPRSMQGEVLDPYGIQTASIASLFHRLLIFEPEMNPFPVLRWPALYAVLYPLCQVMVLLPVFAGIRPSHSSRDTEQLEWAAFVCALLVLSPVPSSYHFAVLIFPAVIAGHALWKAKRYPQLAAALLLYFLMCIVGLFHVPAAAKFSWLTVLGFSRLWLGMLLTLVLTIELWKRQRPLLFFRQHRGKAFQLAAVIALFWIAGFLGYRRHFATHDRDTAGRISLPAKVFLATDMQPEPGGFLCTVMRLSGFQILDDHGIAIQPQTIADNATDRLSAAVAANGSVTLVEHANISGSRIEEVPQPEQSFQPSLEISEATDPAISADGQSIAFIRDDKGRGRLWTAHLLQNASHRSLENPTQVTSAAYDVSHAAFAPSGGIFFSARIDGHDSIFTVDPGQQPQPVTNSAGDTDSPAVSSDGQWLAFRRLEHNRWQLALLNLSIRQERTLTSGDCNAYSPAWMDAHTIGYSTDCARGLGLPALASIRIVR